MGRSKIKNLYRLKRKEEIERNLGKLPKTLEATYSQIWNDIHRSGTTDIDQLEHVRKALAWVMCSQRPVLTPERWAEFTFWPRPAPENGTDVLFDICRNLVTWDKQVNRVIFAHLSVQEYLERNVFTSVDAHSIATESCLSLLSDPTYWAEVSDTLSQQIREQFRERRSAPFPLLFSAQSRISWKCRGGDLLDYSARY